MFLVNKLDPRSVWPVTIKSIPSNETRTGGKNSRGIRVSSYDPDDPSSGAAAGGMQASQPTSGGYDAVATGPGSGGNGGSNCMASKTLGNQRKFQPGGQRVATISQNYNEKTMLLSSDDEYQ